MEKQILGCTSRKLSRLGLGSMNFGWRADEASSRAILDAYRTLGGTLIQGLSYHLADRRAVNLTSAADRIVRRWWQSRRISRQEIVLSTRVNPGHQGTVGRQNLMDRVVSACDESLRRLGTDHLDIFVLDCSDRSLPMEPLRSAMDILVRTGRARYLALANVQAWKAADSIRGAPDHNHCRIEAIQADYSLHRRLQAETELLDLCAKHRLGFIAQVPLPTGLVSTRLAMPTEADRHRSDWIGDSLSKAGSHHITRSTAENARQRRFSAAQIALAWVLHNPAVTSAIINAYSVSHLHDLAGALEVDLSGDDLVNLNRVSRVQCHTLRGRWQQPRPLPGGNRHSRQIVVPV